MARTTVDEARSWLEEGDPHGEEPVLLPPHVLGELGLADVPDGVAIEVGVQKGGGIELEWSGAIVRAANDFVGQSEYFHSRKYWYEVLGLEPFMDLVRRAVETRQRVRGDVSLSHYDDDGAVIQLGIVIQTSEKNLKAAYEHVRRVVVEVEEVAGQTVVDIERQVGQIATRLSGWGADSLDAVVTRVETASTSEEKGKSLEELCSRLLESVPGFTVTGRIRTATEEIDISIINASTEARLRQESPLILAECKNWSSKCGKNEFVIFAQKIANRVSRSRLGFLISWNGFAETVTKEMLRGSQGDILVVPVTGEEIRKAVRSKDAQGTFLECWDRAVQL